MASHDRVAVLRQIEVLFEAGAVAERTDGQLLERFAARRDRRGRVGR